MHKVLVTGGAGFIGSHSLEALARREVETVVLDDFSTGRRHNVPAGVPVIEGSILDPLALAKAIDGCDAVLHLAAIASVQRSVAAPREVHAINVTGTLNVLEAARENGIRTFVMASSSAVYGDAPPPIVEDAPRRPTSPYGVSKLAAEEYGRVFSMLYDMDVVALRYFNVFGPRQDPKSPYSGVLTLFIDAATQERQANIYSDGLQSRDFVYVGDLAEANCLALERSSQCRGEIINIGTGRSVTVLEAHREISNALRVTRPPRHEPARSGEVRHSRARVERALELLGWKAHTDFVTGIKLTTANWAQVMS